MTKAKEQIFDNAKVFIDEIFEKEPEAIVTVFVDGKLDSVLDIDAWENRDNKSILIPERKEIYKQYKAPDVVLTNTTFPWAQYDIHLVGVKGD